MSTFEQLFLKPVLQHYAAPADAEADYEGFAEQYERALGGYEPDVLRLARDRLISEVKGYPLLRISACKEACDKARQHLYPPDLPRRRDPFTGPSRQQLDTAKGLINSELGRRAAAEGWIIPLWDFLIEHARLPDDAETAPMKARAASVAAKFSGQGVIGPMAAFRRAVQGKIARLSEFAKGETA
jgi:hypothetical protein